MPNNFEAGDVVVLKSGGPKMTVKKYEATAGYNCQWFGGKKLESGWFAPESIVAATPDAEK